MSCHLRRQSSGKKSARKILWRERMMVLSLIEDASGDLDKIANIDCRWIYLRKGEGNNPQTFRSAEDIGQRRGNHQRRFFRSTSEEKRQLLIVRKLHIL